MIEKIFTYSTESSSHRRTSLRDEMLSWECRKFSVDGSVKVATAPPEEQRHHRGDVGQGQQGQPRDVAGGGPGRHFVGRLVRQGVDRGQFGADQAQGRTRPWVRCLPPPERGPLLPEVLHHGHDRGVGRLGLARGQGINHLLHRSLAELPEHFHHIQLRRRDVWTVFTGHLLLHRY